MEHKTFLESLIRQTARQEKGSALGKDFHEGSPTAFHGYHPEDEEYWHDGSGGYGGHGRKNRGFQVRSGEEDANLLDPDHDPNLNMPFGHEDDGTEAIATSPLIKTPRPSGYSSDAGYHAPSGQAPSAPSAGAGKLQMRMKLIKLNGEIARLTKERDELKKQMGGGAV